MESQTGNVKTADTSTQNQKTEPLKLPSKAELLKNPMKYIELAIGQFQALSERVENTEKAITILAQTNEALMPLVELAKTVKQRQDQAQASGATNIPQGQGLGGLFMQLAPRLIGGGGLDEEMRALNKEIMQMSIQRMKADIGFTEAIKNAVVSKIAGKAAAGLVE